MKLRTYYRVSAKGKVLAKAMLDPRQIADLNWSLKNGEKMFRFPPKIKIETK